MISLTWDEPRSAFVDFSKNQVDRALSYCQAHRRCMSCGVKAEREEFKTPCVIDDDLHFLGIVFRKYDFAYVVDDREGHLYTICQILYIGKNLMLALRVYERSADANKLFDGVRRYLLADNVTSHLLAYLAVVETVRRDIDNTCTPN